MTGRCPRTLPLGIDIGAVLTRIALLAIGEAQVPEVIAVATRPTGANPAAALASAFAELNTRERRCVLALDGQSSLLRITAFPRMSAGERRRAAHFAHADHYGTVDQCTIRVQPLTDGRCLVAAARRSAVEAAESAARSAGLRPVAVDDAGLALARSLPGADVLVDIGFMHTRLIVRLDPVPFVDVVGGGGAAITRAIADDLGIDMERAESRKRAVGIAGAGAGAVEESAREIAMRLIDARSMTTRPLRTLTIVGNGGRLPTLVQAIERATALHIVPAQLRSSVRSPFPADVLRAASADWALAYGCALWGHPA